MPGAKFQSLVGELKSHMPHRVAKNKNQIRSSVLNQTPTYTKLRTTLRITNPQFMKNHTTKTLSKNTTTIFSPVRWARLPIFDLSQNVSILQPCTLRPNTLKKGLSI